jgi:hypothetical protein
MHTSVTRRGFLSGAIGACALTLFPTHGVAESMTPAGDTGLDFPVVDLHVHLDNSTIDKVLELSNERRIRFGIVEHAGTKENQYPVVLSTDAELTSYLAMLDGKPVYKGVQAEWTDWMGCFSREMLARLDFILSDAMTFPGPDGRRRKLWEGGVDIGDPQRFMDRFVDWHVEILSKEPLDILANVSWLPQAIAAGYDALWTEPRMTKVIETAVKYQVALEISSSFKLPKLPFLKLAKAAGVKFTFGSNGRYPNMGKLDYSIRTAKELGLTRSDMFTPAPDGQRAVQRRLA